MMVPLNDEHANWYGTYNFQFLGFFEAKMDASNNYVPIEGTENYPTGWNMSSRDTTSTGSKFTFQYPPTGYPKPANYERVRIVVEIFATDVMTLTIWLKSYVWHDPSSDSFLAFAIRLNNTANYTASITRPDRLQVDMVYVGSPQFAHGELHNQSRIERVLTRFYAPQGSDPTTYWIVHNSFSQNLFHKVFLGYGIEDRPNVGVLVGLTCFGIIVLTCGVTALVIFGRKIEKKYGKKFQFGR